MSSDEPRSKNVSADCQSGNVTACAAAPLHSISTMSSGSFVVQNESWRNMNKYKLQARPAEPKYQQSWLVQKARTTIPVLNDDQIVIGLTEAINLAVIRNTTESYRPTSKDPLFDFCSSSIPEISTRDYIERLVKYAECSKSAFPIAFVYLRRLEKADEIHGISYYNMHRLLITALMLAAKMIDDRIYTNTHYAKVGGISSVREINSLEIKMLGLLKYKLMVTPEEYGKIVLRLLSKHVPPSHTIPIVPFRFVHTPSQVSYISVLRYSRQEPALSKQCYILQPSSSWPQLQRLLRSSKPQWIHEICGLKVIAFLARDESNAMNSSSFLDRHKALSFPRCIEKVMSRAVSTEGSLSICRSKFLGGAPSVVPTVILNCVRIDDAGHLAVKHFEAFLKAAGINLECVNVFHLFDETNSGNIGCIDPNSVASAMRNIADVTESNSSHIVIHFKKDGEERIVLDYGLASATRDMASATFAVIVAEGRR